MNSHKDVPEETRRLIALSTKISLFNESMEGVALRMIKHLERLSLLEGLSFSTQQKENLVQRIKKCDIPLADKVYTTLGKASPIYLADGTHVSHKLYIAKAINNRAVDPHSLTEIPELIYDHKGDTTTRRYILDILANKTLVEAMHYESDQHPITLLGRITTLGYEQDKQKLWRMRMPLLFLPTHDQGLQSILNAWQRKRAKYERITFKARVFPHVEELKDKREDFVLEGEKGNRDIVLVSSPREQFEEAITRIQYESFMKDPQAQRVYKQQLEENERATFKQQLALQKRLEEKKRGIW